MKIVVTGGCGFIGSSFVNYLRQRKGVDVNDILVIDKLTYASNKELIESTIPFLQKDICDVTIDDIGSNVEYIVNFAAESHVDNSIKNGLPFVKTNVEGTFNMLEIARKLPKLKKFVQISTDEVYGDMDSAQMTSATETARLHPSSYYSATKAAADHLVLAAKRTYGLPILITRTCNNFGINQHREKFLPTIYNSIMEGRPIPLYGDGLHKREWIWVEDNVRLITTLMFKETGIWNVGSGDVWDNKSIIERIGGILGKKVDFQYVDDRLGHDRRYTINSNKLEMKMKTYKLTTKLLDKYLQETFG
jgi:dTDP-glucose 4,6-dehydratase